MKLSALLVLLACLQVSASGLAQNISLQEKNSPLDKIFKEVKKQTGYDFFYESRLLKNTRPVNISVVDASIEEVMAICFRNQPISYTIVEKTILINEKQPEIQRLAESGLLPPVLLKGTILDDKTGEPIVGASVVVKGAATGVSTNKEGLFTITVSNEKEAVLVVTHIGYTSREVPVKGTGAITIRLAPAEQVLEEVEISAGILSRKKETFTGAVASFTGKELRQIGNLNLVQSLKTLDPSFIVVADNQLGSNPNQVPKIEVRGKTSITTTTEVRDQFTTDPNQPLFILNGMETTLQQILDLDINRVASVTLLKDAASTALYGSRAANGVVVVETIRPKPGQMSLSYTSSLRVEMPDLRDYNMMNAAENLEFQRLAGMYKNTTSQAYYIDNLYNTRLKSVLSGINSYWLNVPLRNSVTQAHSLSVNGGSHEFQYTIGLNYRKLNGVMKGSDRITPGATIDLSYRKGKINISNQFYVNGFTSNESPYGSFADYVNLNPYYNKYDSTGRLNTNRYFETYLKPRAGNPADTIRVTNPLYNATLNVVNRTTNTVIQDNLQLIWDMAKNWRFSTGVQVSKGSSNTTLFYPANHTRFEQTEYARRGTYSNTRRDDASYQTNIMLTYRKVINGVHSITGNLRGELQEIKSSFLSVAAEGFPEGVNANPAFAYSYQQGGKPAYSSSKVRRANALASFNYAFNNRYYIDATYRLDGSTSFGSEKKYSPFWSAGLGWTVSKEKWFSNVTWLSNLRLRGNIGVAGNQSLGSYASSSIYGYETNLSPFGQGLYLNQLGNPNLEWQKTTTTSVGIDAVLSGNRLTLTLNGYRKVSSPLIATGNNPTSSGVSTYVLNVGELKTEGVELVTRYSPVYNTSKGIVWTLGVTGAIYKSEYGGFSNILKNLNDAAQNSKQLQRYLDGYSPDELWAVTSMGIDPATGVEVFKRKDGTYSTVYNVADIVPQGQSRPTVEGVLSSNINYKGFLLGVNLRYSLGAHIFNSALYTKVENISEADLPKNHDKRALELRWKQAGDIAQFKSINLTSTTQMSSRFIQEENYLAGESINVGYEFAGKQYPWLGKAGLKSMRLNAYMNDIFRLSNIKSERGIDYPFSRAVSLSLNLFF